MNGNGTSSGQASGGSSDIKGSEEKQEQEGESQDKVNTTAMVIDSELDKNRNEISWSEIKKEIEQLNESWTVIIIDLYALDVKKENILEFSDKLNASMMAIKNEDKIKSLTSLADLYASIPQFLNDIDAEENMQKIRQTQSHVINAYVLAEDIQSSDINQHIGKAIEVYSEVMTNIDYTKDKTEKINKIYVLLNELENSLEDKNADIFYLKYKNFMKEIQAI